MANISASSSSLPCTNELVDSNRSPAVWGKPVWGALFAIANCYPCSNPNRNEILSTRKFFTHLAIMMDQILCSVCASHLQKNVSSPEFENALATGQESLLAWLNKLKNEIKQQQHNVVTSSAVVPPPTTTTVTRLSTILSTVSAASKDSKNGDDKKHKKKEKEKKKESKNGGDKGGGAGNAKMTRRDKKDKKKESKNREEEQQQQQQKQVAIVGSKSEVAVSNLSAKPAGCGCKQNFKKSLVIEKSQK